ncbi:putative Glycosyl transferase, family 39 [Sulfurimonas gotlandica GD1]|uniref:Putative Glycosyl transferase, family 39 n=1 Tax=Sulfurimonas gotlandica (strain DSM 19862 / JCM 16533 / GD1) TaxID=929558 RepID=B6BKE6_SULGG|nr:glycosyl transferase [Sulfurimonas gotlandica]EDZ62239.1 hypothetical protein CBGD1_154 [Sulfurimonas gotlandica GD1]EHP29001.1 putative Glycosyl transferase, family 39 [Sulfurimonas gotlandica GD1]
MLPLNKNYIALVSILAYVVYIIVNFIYFSIGTVFGDETRFIAEAITLSESGEFWNYKDRAWEMPLTAVIYSIFYSLFENERNLIIFVRLFQPLLLVLQAFLLYKISLKIFDNKLSALIAFTITLFYPFFIFYQGLLLSETFFNTVLIVSFYFIYRWYEDDFKIDTSFLLANIFLLLSIYIKGTLSILPPLLLTVFFVVNKLELKSAIKVFLYSTLIYIFLMTPWWIRNYMIFDQFVPFTTSSGKVLYLGNNPANKYGGCDMAVDVDRKEFTSIGTIDDELERNKLFKYKAIEFIKNNPDRFFELMLLKFKRFYNIIPNADKYKQGYFKWITLVSYGSIFTLFLVSIVIHAKYYKRLTAIYILFIYFTLLHMVFIASLRYRLPLEPFMILLSSNVIAIIYRRIYGSKN